MKNLVKSIFLIVILLFSSKIVKGNELVYQADKATELMQEKNYFSAIQIWENILLSQPNHANYNYKAGLCYFNINQEIKAITYFEKAIVKTGKKYTFSNNSLDFAPIDAIFFYAKSNHIKGDIKKAFEYYNKFYKAASKKHELRIAAELGAYQCGRANVLITNPQPYIIRNLGDTINSEKSEYRPVISLDGSEIYFTSTRLRPDSSNKDFINPQNGNYFEDIYVSYRNIDGSWSNPKLLDFCQPSRNDASVSISLNGDKIFIYYGNQGNGDIYYSNINELEFDKIQPFPAEDLNSPYTESHASISSDGNTIYFSSDRPGGYGGKDIYRIKKMPDGTWSKAQNLGPEINSEFDEEAPFIGADNTTLYFSSNGKMSMGGYDIFVAQMNELGDWSEPTNLGYPLNSFGDDLYYSTMANGFMGIYCSNQLNGSGDYDLYFVQTENSYYKNVTILKGQISTTDLTILPKGISIHVKDLTEDSKEVIFAPRLRDGSYILNLKPCHSYKITYMFNNEIFHETEKLVPCNSSYQEINEEIFLDVVNFKVVNKTINHE